MMRTDNETDRMFAALLINLGQVAGALSDEQMVHLLAASLARHGGLRRGYLEVVRDKLDQALRLADELRDKEGM